MECDGIVKPHRNVFIILSFFDKEVVIFLTYIGLKKQCTPYLEVKTGFFSFPLYANDSIALYVVV